MKFILAYVGTEDLILRATFLFLLFGKGICMDLINHLVKNVFPQLTVDIDSFSYKGQD